MQVNMETKRNTVGQAQPARHPDSTAGRQVAKGRYKQIPYREKQEQRKTEPPTDRQQCGHTNDEIDEHRQAPGR